MGFIERCKNVVVEGAKSVARGVVKAAKSAYVWCAAVVGLGVQLASAQQSTPTINTSIGGYEAASWVTACVTSAATILGAVLAGYFLFLMVKVIRKGANRATNG